MSAVTPASPERLARAALSRIGEPGDPRLTGLVTALGAVEVWQSLRDQAAALDLGADLAERIAGCDPAEELARAERLGIRFVVPEDDEWPSRLGDLAHTPAIHRRGGVPVGLWVRGPHRLDRFLARAVAVVGSRSATTTGVEVAAGIGATLAEATTTVVSGAAFGIDQAGHRGALAVDGPTVAVLACGVDRAYPAAHRDLLEHLAKVGLVISEAAPGCAPTRIRFLARNRLIAGLSQGTVVVEAAVRSGALNTATWTDALGRPVMGVPGPVTSAPSAGVHQLIRTRGALLVTRGEEVLEAVAPSGTALLVDPREPANPRDLIRPVDQQVLDAVPLLRGATTVAVARTAGLRSTTVDASLTRLREAGLVDAFEGRWRLAGDAVPTQRTSTVGDDGSDDPGDDPRVTSAGEDVSSTARGRTEPRLTW